MKTITKYKSIRADIQIASEQIIVSYVQVYDTLSMVCSHLTIPSAYPLIFFILGNIKEHNNNEFVSDAQFQESFMKLHGVAVSTYKRSMKQLRDLGIIIQTGKRGKYIFNPHLAWRGGTEERINWIKNNIHSTITKNHLK